MVHALRSFWHASYILFPSTSPSCLCFPKQRLILYFPHFQNSSLQILHKFLHSMDVGYMCVFLFCKSRVNIRLANQPHIAPLCRQFSSQDMAITYPTLQLESNAMLHNVIPTCPKLVSDSVFSMQMLLIVFSASFCDNIHFLSIHLTNPVF